ncbi:phosphotransferase family protein [Mycolicibacter kumamotonensis]|uniref:Phosphotransferase family protein n=1 Tax=Mycolicibacter kumamotonensis TaxID=354243 RepID=A0A7K3L643_9MYCO|nr:phosphotransferase family protein [Mycolicibacter kumamotonensis]NDJ87879.1 phosphotransferase family protein [Mycolicibacter kumamotonensis]
MSDEETITGWISRKMGARVTSITRQARWRSAWLVDAERDGLVLPLIVRGERGAGIPMQFPLHHEMSLQRTMEEQGIRVPRVHGWIDELPAYVMDRVDGRPGFEDLTIEQRDALMRDYMAELAKLHRLPLQPFLEAGIQRAPTPAEAGSYGIGRFEAVWRAGKNAPNPLLEFVLGWLKRNPVQTNGRESAIVWDSGQLHQRDGHLVALLDVEAGHIGDPMMDLAAPRMRDTVLHFGDFEALYQEYERAGGFPVDMDAIQLHHIAFTLTNELAFRNSLNAPEPDSDYMTNLHWCSETNLHAIEALGERLGIDLEAPEIPAAAATRAATAHDQLIHMLRGVSSDDEYIRYRLRVAFRLARYVKREDEIGAELTNADLDDLAPLLDYRPDTWQEGDAALEQFVLADHGQHDEQLCQLFYRRQIRHKSALGPPGSAMVVHHTCQPFPSRASF